MEEEEHTDRKLQLAKLYQKLNKIKKSLNEGNTRAGYRFYTGHNILYYCMLFVSLWHLSLFSDDTDNINKVIGLNSPDSCFSYLMDLEKKGDPHLHHSHLTRLIDVYTRVFSSMPVGKHCQNENYARMLVRFAELKAWVEAVTLTKITFIQHEITWISMHFNGSVMDIWSFAGFLLF